MGGGGSRVALSHGMTVCIGRGAIQWQAAEAGSLWNQFIPPL